MISIAIMITVGGFVVGSGFGVDAAELEQASVDRSVNERPVPKQTDHRVGCGNFDINSFTTASNSPFATGTGPIEPAVGDFNNDGIQDIIVANFSGTVSYFQGIGDGNFNPAVSIVTGGNNTTNRLAINDFNNDGNQDFAASNSNARNIVVFLGNGSGGFTQASGSPISGSTINVTYGIATADFNLDGNPDMAVAQLFTNLVILLGDGTGAFTLAPNPPGLISGALGIETGDFNNDSIPDLAFVNGQGVLIRSLLGDGTGQFPTAFSVANRLGTDRSRTIRIADFNNDGNEDVIVDSADNNTVTIALGNGTGAFFLTESTRIDVGFKTYGIETADFDNDGNVDFIASRNDVSGALALRLGNGDATFRDGGTLSGLAQINQLSMGDFNNDSSLDFVSTISSINAMSTYLGACTASVEDEAILFASSRDGGNPQIYKMNSDGSNPIRLTNGAASDATATWSPDKTKIVFSRFVGTGITELWIMNSDGSNPTQLTNNTGFSDQNPSFKPDGSKILYSHCETVNFTCDLYTMNIDGSDQQLWPLSHPVNDDDQAFYSPDGTKIVWSAYVVATNETGLYIANADGTGSITQLTTGTYPNVDSFARFSPDSSKLVWTRYADYGNADTGEVYTINTDGTNSTRLTSNSVAEIRPVWSPDGSKILYSSRQDGDYEIYTMNALTGAVTDQLTVNTASDYVNDWYVGTTAVANNALFDFDGDGRSDRSVFRSSDTTWYLDGSTDGFAAIQFGLGTDTLAPADYDGDGKTDVAVWRASEGNFYIYNSSDSSVRVENFGLAGDVVTVGDWDGDGKADLSVYREGSQSTIYYRGSDNNPSGNITFVPWGTTGDKPVVGDFDGDGIQDAAVFRPSNKVWYIRRSSDNTVNYVNFGIASDKLVPADYDGDGKTDVAVYRDGVWYILQSSNSQVRYEYFGLSTDVVVPADYDGDGKADVAVFRNGVWYLNQSTSGFAVSTFGTSGDRAVPNAYVNP